MKNLSIAVLKAIVKSKATTDVRVSNGGRFPITVNMANKLLELTGGDAESPVLTDRVVFLKTVHELVGGGSLMKGLRNY
ncbi:hypothetical protein [Vibrio phage V-YDF132]|nr:hypothetical protein [Vibrio phage V-YDF132]